MGVMLVITFIAIVFAGAVYKYDIQPGFTRSNPVSQCQYAIEAANPIVAENSCPGTTSWRLDHPTGPDLAIEGFTAPVSVNRGESVKMYISTTAPTYTFQIYRIGWYPGLGGHLVYSSPVLHGINQPPPTIDPTTHMVSCSNWHNPVTVAIPTTWVSGVYVVKLLSSAGYMRYTSFVVRDDTSSSPILFQTSVLTYQAYNGWGGYNLYRGHIGTGEEASSDQAYVVSFDRPIDRGAGLGDFPLTGLVGNEYDRIYRNGATPSSLSVIASSPLKCMNTSSLCPSSGNDVAYATLYTASSGATVFDAGTFYWGWGLDDDSSFVPSDPIDS